MHICIQFDGNEINAGLLDDDYELIVHERLTVEERRALYAVARKILKNEIYCAQDHLYQGEEI